MGDSAEAPAAKPRYGIYAVAAPETRLWAFGSSVLGYDAIDGCAVAFPKGLADGLDWDALTREPRRYGFHGTLKAPFELAENASEGGLLAAAQSFAEGRPAVPATQIAVREIDRFVALVPVPPSQALNELAAACVRSFDALRAPMGEEDRERRLRSPLTARQLGYLDTWGYPYVLEEFRFHMTLTGPLGSDTIAPVRDRLTALYAEIAEPLSVDAIAVVVQPTRSAPFRVLRRFALLG